MFVVKETEEKFQFNSDKITSRIARLCYGLDAKHIDPGQNHPKNYLRCLRRCYYHRIRFNLAAETSVPT